VIALTIDVATSPDETFLRCREPRVRDFRRGIPGKNSNDLLLLDVAGEIIFRMLVAVILSTPLRCFGPGL